MTIRSDAKQWSPEWLAARAGNATASRMVDVMAKLKGNGESAQRRNYRDQLVAEILTGLTQDDIFVSREMQWGTDNEAFARSAYELKADVLTDLVGFGLHETLPRYGGSPDGLVDKDGLVEMKCPKTTTHIKYLLTGIPPEEYQLQMLCLMDVWEREWCDFVSYDPRLPENLQLFVVRFHRDKMRIAELQDGVIKFNAEVDALVNKLREWRG